MNDVVIIGAGGFGRETWDWLIHKFDSQAAEGRRRVPKILGFLDDGTPEIERLGRIGATHLGPIERLADLEAFYYVAVGDPATRSQIVKKCDAMGAIPGPALIHPTVTVGSDVELGDGTIVCPGAVVTTDVRIGIHVHLNLVTTIGHDCVLGDCVTVNPGACVSGDVTLGEGVMIGTGATVNQGLQVGARSIVGAGAAVVRDVPPDSTVVGVPARPRDN